MGLGHVVRSLALAAMFPDHERIFIIREPLTALKAQINSICESIVVLPSTTDDVAEAHLLADEHLRDSDLLVTDGYHFNTDYQKVARAACRALIAIDDIHAFPFVADAVINHAPCIRHVYDQLLLNGNLYSGLDYALLRNQFIEAAIGPILPLEQRPEAIFICFGGADSYGLTYRAVQSLLASFENYKLNVVLGAAAQSSSLVELSKKESRVRLYHSLSAERMVNLMQESQVAIVPASSILYEVCAVRMPVVSGYYVDNQSLIYRGFLQLGCIEGVGNFLKLKDYGVPVRRALQRGIEFMRIQAEQLSGNSPACLKQVINSLL